MKKEGIFVFDAEKNAFLKRTRGINFEDVIFFIEKGAVLDIIFHHNKEQYPDQKIMLIEIDSYVYQVPFKHEGEDIRLITVFPSRKFTAKYLKGKGSEYDKR